MSATGLSMDYATFSETAPSARAALIDMGKAVEASGLDKALTELVKVRVSQINGCGFCLALHLGWAREAAVAQDKLDFLTVWHEVDVFSPRERAALAEATPPRGFPHGVGNGYLYDAGAGQRFMLRATSSGALSLYRPTRARNLP